MWDAKLLIDCGLTGKKAFERMAVHDRDARELTAVLVSHDHRDHVRGVGVLARRCRIPIFATGGTWEVLPRKGVGLIPDRRSFVAGDTLLFGETRVETIPTPHDGEDGVAFVVEAEGRRLGVFTDLGHPFPGLAEALASTDLSYVESNYDPAMLESGPYPIHLQERIRGDAGHISNEEAARLGREAASGRLTRVVLCHLSQENNTPERALRTAHAEDGAGLRFEIAGRYGTSDLFEV
jgi:phosphoribosyl 1,2-cyclic phosphodiesterase